MERVITAAGWQCRCDSIHGSVGADGGGLADRLGARFPRRVPRAPGELLQTLDWMIGEWVNEGVDGRVSIKYQWSEDRNFILGEFVVSSEGQVVAKSSQRIGWDPRTGKPRSWLFDSDGGFSEAEWTPTETGWMLRSAAVLPDGSTGSATVRMEIEDANRFRLAGKDRVIGNQTGEDFELTVVQSEHPRVSDEWSRRAC